MLDLIVKGLKIVFSNPSKFVKNHPNIMVDEETILLKRVKFQIFPTNKITIGKGCMLSNYFIFESKQGEIIVGDRTFIHTDTKLISRSKISIGSDVMISWGCTLYDHNSHSLDWNERVKDIERKRKAYYQGEDLLKSKDWDVVKIGELVIKDKVWIGFGVTVLQGVTVGEGAVIGAESVVREDVLPWTVVAGNPAVFLRNINH